MEPRVRAERERRVVGVAKRARVRLGPVCRGRRAAGDAAAGPIAAKSGTAAAGNNMFARRSRHACPLIIHNRRVVGEIECGRGSNGDVADDLHGYWHSRISNQLFAGGQLESVDTASRSNRLAYSCPVDSQAIVTGSSE